MIDGVIVQPLDQIVDERGKVMHMLRKDSPLYKGFGEVYFSVVNPGVVKAWKKHSKMTQNFAAPSGEIRVVLYDDREQSSTKGEIQIVEIGEKNYSLLRIPPLLWYGFQGISSVPAIIANCTDLPHDPNEVERIPLSDKTIPYSWIT